MMLICLLSRELYDEQLALSISPDRIQVQAILASVTITSITRWSSNKHPTTLLTLPVLAGSLYLIGSSMTVVYQPVRLPRFE